MAAFWRQFGTGERECLAFHCALAHSGAWKGVAAELSDDLTICAMDFPGHGKSGGAPDDPDHVDQAIAWAADRLDEPKDIFGHSFGAYISLRLALLYPEKVKSLWLFEPVLMAAVRESDPDLHARNESEMTEVAALIAQGNRESATRFFMRIWGDGRPWMSLGPEARAYFQERMTQPCQTQPWLADDVVGVLPQLKSLTMPVHLLDGEKSPAIMAKVQDNLAALIPNASRETVKGAFHMGPVSHPIECAASIRSHIGLSG